MEHLQILLVEITGLIEDSSYDFRAYSSNGEDSAYSDTFTTSTQINDPFFDDSSYKVMNVGGAADSKWSL